MLGNGFIKAQNNGFIKAQNNGFIKVQNNGFIKVQNFRKSRNKLASVYPLKPTGITEKAGLTVRFLARKVAEYESLTLEIEALKSEMNTAQSKSVTIHD